MATEPPEPDQPAEPEAATMMTLNSGFKVKDLEFDARLYHD